MKVQKKKGKYLWVIIISVVFLSLAGCTTMFSPSTETNGFDNWTIFQSQIRDVLVLDNELIIISNSAPWIGIGPNSGKPYIVAFNPQTHKTIWKLEYMAVAPISGNSEKIFVLEDSQLVAVDLEQGNEKWSIPFKAIGFPQMFSDEDLVLVADNQTLYAFNTQNGQLQWTSEAHLPFDISVPDLTNFTSWREHNALTKHGHIVFARRKVSQNAKECQMSVAALDATNGTEIWQHSFSLPMISEGCLPGILPLASNNEIVLMGVLGDSSNQCTLNAFDINTGEINWTYTNVENCSTGSSLMFFDEEIIAVTSSDVVKFDPQNGHLVSRQSLPLGGFHKLISTEGTIVARSSDLNQNIYRILDLQGNKVYEFKLSLPSECNAQTEIAGVTNQQAIFVNSSCVQPININEGKLIAK